ncbi:MAG: hypothetical protein ABMB14_34905, partial [Myxococcota bacterium]
MWNQHAYTVTNVDDDLSIPAHPVPNWTVYDSFRAGEPVFPAPAWDDLTAEVVDVCLDECPDTLHLLVRVANAGTSEVPAGIDVAVRAGEGGPIVATGAVPVAIASGFTSEGVTIAVVGRGRPGRARRRHAGRVRRGEQPGPVGRELPLAGRWGPGWPVISRACDDPAMPRTMSTKAPPGRRLVLSDREVDLDTGAVEGHGRLRPTERALLGFLADRVGVWVG